MKAVRNAAIAFATISLFGVCVACAPTDVEEKEGVPADPVGGVAVSQKVLAQINGGDNVQWAEEYPDQFLSYLSGVGELEPSVAPESDLGDLHSHAALRVSMDEYGAQDGQISYLESSGASCLSCKSPYFNELYEQKGMEAYKVTYADVQGKYAYWDCLTCHEEKPGDPVGAKLVAGTTLLRNFPVELTDKDLACAQCHNSLTPYSREEMSDKFIAEGTSLSAIDPYRYGVDADALLKAELEDGVTLSVDEASGLQTFYVPVSEIEIFQGSTHQSMGLTCVDCHMPSTTNERGEAYTMHNASQGPLENDVALEKCLTCHENQGIDGIDEMRDWAHGKQAALGVQEDELADKLAQLKDLVTAGVEGGAEAAVLDKARDNYLMRSFTSITRRAPCRRPGRRSRTTPRLAATTSSAARSWQTKRSLCSNPPSGKAGCDPPSPHACVW